MSQPRILVVEDNDDNALICCTALQHYGFDTMRAADGPEGLRLARASEPDLILLDLSLPGMSGWDVAERLRADPRTADIPIVIWSAHDTPADHARAERLGCAGYLVKPCEIRPLLRAVQRAVGMRPARPAEPAAASGAVSTGFRSRRLLGGVAVVAALAVAFARLRPPPGRERRKSRPVPRLSQAMSAA